MRRMKKSNKLFKAAMAATVVTGAFVASVPTYTEAAPAITELTDLEKEQDYYEAVKILLERGAIQGYPDLTYRPYEPVTRGQAAKVLAHFLQLDLSNVENPRFVDVKETDEYYTAIAALVEKGVIKGYDDYTFRQNNPLTRAQMAKMVVIGFDLNLEQSSEIALPFIDVKESDAFAIYIQALSNYDITKGVSENQFAPNKNVTRGQMASFITRGEAALAVSEVSGEILEVEENKIILSTGTYIVPKSLQGIFNIRNTEALEGANVSLKKDGKVLRSVQSLELVGDGSETTGLYFDGHGDEIEGDLIIAGNFNTTQNVKVKGNLEVSGSGLGAFNVNDVVVEGETRILTKEMVEEEGTGSVTFSDSTLESIVISKNGVVVDVKGSTTLKNVVANSKTTLNADYGYVFPSVTLSKGIQTFTTNSEIDHLIAKEESALTINGEGRIMLLEAHSVAPIFIDLPGSVNELEVHNADVRISLGRKTIVGHLYLPLLTTVKQVIANFEDIFRNIEMIDGEMNEP